MVNSNRKGKKRKPRKRKERVSNFGKANTIKDMPAGSQKGKKVTKGDKAEKHSPVQIRTQRGKEWLQGKEGYIKMLRLSDLPRRGKN